MKCQHCGNEIPDNSKVCSSCGKPVDAAADAWYKKWWVWLIAALVVAGIAIACVFALSGNSGDKKATEPATQAVTEAATTASTAATQAATKAAETEAATEVTIEQIIKQGYEKIGYIKLYNNIDKYKGKKILTVVDVDDIGDSALYSSVVLDKKTLAFYKFVFSDSKEIKDVKKGDYVVIYGTVNPQGAVSSTIEVDECHIAATGKNAKDYFNSIKDEKPVAPTAKPTTKPTAKPTSKPTTKPTEKPTTAPTAKPTTSPSPSPETEATSAPETTSEGYTVISKEKGFIISYIDKVYDPEIEAMIYKIHVENNSGTNVFIGAQDSTVNGKKIDLIAVDYIENGEKLDSEMYILQSDLDELGITDINEIKFKFLYEDPDDWDNPVITDYIILKP